MNKLSSANSFEPGGNVLQKVLSHPSSQDTVALKPVIRLEHIEKTYGLGEAAVIACNDISLSINSGEYCAIMGLSGSGKTTLMNIIGCLDRPTFGEYYLDGVNVTRLNKSQLARIRNQKIGYIFQRYELLPNLTALENVILPMMYAGVNRSVRRRRATKALTQVGLAERLYKRPTQLSGGQQQRVAIARAIVNRPVLLLADEPTGALDTKSAEDVLKIFRALHQTGMTIVMVTHSSEVATHSQRVIMMGDGKVMWENLSPEDI